MDIRQRFRSAVTQAAESIRKIEGRRLRPQSIGVLYDLVLCVLRITEPERDQTPVDSRRSSQRVKKQL